MRRWGIVLAALAAISLATAACSSGSGSSASSGSETVKVGLSEYRISPDLQSVKSGKVTFDVANDGDQVHEMVLIKTDAAPGDLPMQKGEASEAGSVGEVSELDAGASGTLTIHLAPGRYVMICNVPGHYVAGMHTEFTVS